MHKVLKSLRLIFTVATVGVILILCWQCLDIYLSGNHSENIVDGVYLTQVYSVQIVSERLLNLTSLFVFYAILAVMTILTEIFFGVPQRAYGKIHPCPPRTCSAKKVLIFRLLLLCLGVLFIIAGVANGGSRDVLVKAINICTECIGLG